MKTTTLTVAACTTLLWVGTALAIPTAQQTCNHARIAALNAYQTCIGSVVAKSAKDANNLFAPFAKCRHAYFKKWTAFQPKPALAGTTCIGTRYTDNGDQTVTDNLSGLVWEKKDSGFISIHDTSYLFTWSTGAPYAGNGTAYNGFLEGVTGMNATGFADSNDWRLPTLAELQTIVLDFACKGATRSPTCTCPSLPCVDANLDPVHTQASYYWSATSFVPVPGNAWTVDFGSGTLFPLEDIYPQPVRAVRGGL